MWCFQAEQVSWCRVVYEGQHNPTRYKHVPQGGEANNPKYSRPSRFAWPSVEGFGHAIWEVMHSGESDYLQIIR